MTPRHPTLIAAALCVALAVAAVRPARAQPAVASPGEAAIVKLADAPVLDGKLDDACWRQAVRLPRFTNRGRAVKAETYALLFHDGVTFYVGVYCQEPLIAKIRRTHTERDAPIWNDDCVELFIDANLDRKTYCQFIANAVNGRADAAAAPRRDPKAALLHDFDWASRSHIGVDFWSVEFAIPFRSLNLPAPRPGADGACDIGLTVCRERYPDNEYCSWHGWFHRPEGFGILKGIRVDRDRVPLHCGKPDIGEGLWGENEFSVELLNLSDRDAYALTLAVLAEGNALDTRRQALRLPRGKPTIVTQRYRVPVGKQPGKGYEVHVVLHREGQEKRAPVLSVSRRFKILSTTVADVSLDRCVYYLRHAAANLAVKCCLSRTTVRRGLHFSVSVADDAGRAVYCRENLPFAAQTYVHPIPLVALPEGWYTARVTVSDPRTHEPFTRADLVLRKVRGPFE